MIDKIKGKIKWVRTTNFLAILTLFFSSILFFYDLLSGKYLLTERDLGPYFIPPRFFWVESIKRGDFPLWNPFQFSGHPFFANPQYAILYPLNGLFFLLPFDIAFNAIIILHFFMGGLFTYLFLKDLKVNTTGSLISGLIFMLSGYLLSVHSLLNCLLSVIWTPLIMMFFRRAILRPGFKNEIFTAIFITISFLGGGLEVVYGNFFILFFIVIFSSLPYAAFVEDKPQRYKFIYSLPNYWGRIKPLFKRFRSLSIVSIVFLFLSAIQLLPFLELFGHSIRGGGIPYKEATTWSFAPKDILLFFLPDAYGYFLDMKNYWFAQCWLKTLYTGGLPFILSLVFFLAPHPAPLPHRGEGIEERPLSPPGERGRVAGFGRDRRLYLTLIIFSLFLSLGKYNPFYPFVFKYIPFFNGIRYPVKFLYIFILILSIVAGLGFQRLTDFSKEGEKKKLKMILIIFSLTFGLFLLFFVLGHKGIEHFLKGKGVDFPDFNYLSVNLYHAKRFLFYLALFFLLLRIGLEMKWKNWAKVLLVFFLTADLFGNMGFYRKEKSPDYFQKTRILEMISQDQGHFRVFSTGKTISMDTSILVASATPLDILKEKHLPTMNLLYRLHNVWGIDVITLKRVNNLYKAFTGARSISATNLIDLYGVKYVISVIPIDENRRFELIYSRIEGLKGRREDLLKENTIKLYRNRKPIVRGWLVKDFKVMDSEAMFSRMTSKDFHPDREVLLEEDPKWEGQSFNPAWTKESKGLPKSSVEFISETNNRLLLTVKAQEKTLLVLNDTHFPGWKAFVYPVRCDSHYQVNLADTNLSNRADGKRTKIYRADYAFRAIPVNAGTHQVEFLYDPLSFRLGAVISLLGIIGCVVIGLTTRRRKPL